MSKKLMNDSEVEALRASPYVANVSVRSVSFTPTCRELLYKRMSAGEQLEQVLESLGINTAALGDARIQGLQDRLRQYEKHPEKLTEQMYMRRKKTPEEREMTLEAKVKGLETEVEFLKQTVEFLKKKKQLELECNKQK